MNVEKCYDDTKRHDTQIEGPSSCTAPSTSFTSSEHADEYHTLYLAGGVSIIMHKVTYANGVSMGGHEKSG